MDEAVQFLEIVWGDKEAYVDLPSKVAGHWIQHSFLWPDPELARRRIASCLADGEDVYFSVATFANRGRRHADTNKVVWLWADLDEVNPEVLADHPAGELDPTVAWQSSPGRFQGLWLLDRALRPELIEKLSRALTYTVGADRSGWDLTQVLRVPGTRNHKYPGSPEIELLWANGPQYDVRELWSTLKSAAPEDFLASIESHRSASGGLGAVRERSSLGGRVRALLRAREDEVVAGERSDRLWELECLLAEAGRDEDEIFELVWGSAWNKWRNVGTGGDRLRREIRKAMGHVQRQLVTQSGATVEEEEANTAEGAHANDPTGSLEVAPSALLPAQRAPFANYASFLSANFEAPRWLVEEIWTAKSHGILGGEPKTMKSTLALALAMSVASGKPWLNKFGVGVEGPAIIVQEENDPWVMQDRMRKLASYMGLIRSDEIEAQKQEAGASYAAEIVRLAFPREIPLKLLNNYGFDMAVTEHREMLEEEIRDVQPALVVLDPLYLMVGAADMDKAQHVKPFLQWLLHLRFTYGTAVLLIHHYRKSQVGAPAVRPGQRLLGTNTFHGWVESAGYTEAVEGEGLRTDEVRVRLEREFRNVGPRKALDILLRIGAPGTLDFSAKVTRYDALGELVQIVRDEPGITVRQLADRLQVDRRTALRRANESGEIEVKEVNRGRKRSWELYILP